VTRGTPTRATANGSRAGQRQEQINKVVCKTQMPHPEITPEWMTEGIQNTYDYWDRLADIWEDLYPREGDHQVIAQLIPETNAPIEILDVGCGTGQVWEGVDDGRQDAACRQRVRTGSG